MTSNMYCCEDSQSQVLRALSQWISWQFLNHEMRVVCNLLWRHALFGVCLTETRDLGLNPW